MQEQQGHAYIDLTEEEELELFKNNLWIFGYGSLIWKVDFPISNQFPAYIKGFERRFAQKSQDHRGTVEYPGRVVTLLETGRAEDVVYGMCYCIDKSNVHQVLKHLDFREKNGYARHYVHVYHSHTNERHPALVLLYVGTRQNPQFIDPSTETLEMTAEIIATSVGPSGKNSDYLFNLSRALDEMNVVDEHVKHLELLVKRKLNQNEEKNSTDTQ
jgi:cation transport protein ChaC